MIQKISILVVFAAIIVLSNLPQDMPHGESFNLDCELCHATDSWEVNTSSVKFDHRTTGFPLFGIHQKTECRQCHENLEFTHIGTACVDCHTDIHRSELGFRCQNCHTPQSWENRREMFEQHIETNFPLIGVHAILDCQSCHIDEQNREYANTPVECSGCHLEDYDQTTSPNHVSAGFDTRCDNCHLPNAYLWNQTVYLHADIFPLTGGHSGLECQECHTDIYIGQPADCYFCHQSEYKNSQEPDHLAFGFPQDCAACHTTTSWESADFDHVGISGFALNGAHELAQCTSCHVNNQLTGLPRDCFGCHEDDYNSTTDPSHLQANFSQLCTDCHSEDAWEPTTFDHNLTAFQLTGAHIPLNCNACHSEGYSNTPSDCNACHETDYNNTTDPAHATAQFPTDCSTCHTTNAWEPATFDHNLTAFPLTGAHVPLNCNACHSDGYSNTPTDCMACHETDYNSTTDPAHAAAQFPTDCSSCHTTNAWEPATFDHNLTAFPLTGAHVPLSCNACHAEGYTNTPSECIACHETDYNNTTDPAHAAAQFPTDCADCHSTNAWEPADWDHDGQYFPIYSGSHREKWDNCADCHNNPASYAQFECILCHEHDKTSMDEEHREENDYTYDSPSCYRCHPDGKSDD